MATTPTLSTEDAPEDGDLCFRVLDDGSVEFFTYGEDVEKGDYPGHPFRGNQWSAGGRGGKITDRGALAALKRIEKIFPNAKVDLSRMESSGSAEIDRAACRGMANGLGRMARRYPGVASKVNVFRTNTRTDALADSGVQGRGLFGISVAQDWAWAMSKEINSGRYTVSAINANKSMEAVSRGLMFHEFGHLADARAGEVFGAPMLRSWENLKAHGKGTKLSLDVPSNYARADEQELFAEAWTAYHMGYPPLSRDLKAAIRDVQSKVRKGKSGLRSDTIDVIRDGVIGLLLARGV